ECDASEWTPVVRDALKRLALVITLDHLAGPLADGAHVFLPATTSYESHGAFVNRAGRAQAFAPDRVPSESVIELIRNETFPRQPRLTPPDSDAHPSWWALERLRAQTLGKPEVRDLAGVRAGLASTHAFWQPLRGLAAGGRGVTLDVSSLKIEAPSIAPFSSARGLAVFRVDRTLGSEVLSRRSEPTRRMAGDPVAHLSIADAARSRIDGRIAIEAGGHTIEIDARASRTVPEGVVLVPRDVEWPAPIEPGIVATVGSRATQEIGR